MKIKIKLSQKEFMAVIFICLTIINKHDSKGLADKAAMEIIRKIYLKLMAREGNLKQQNNAVTFSLVEAWAFSVLTDKIGRFLEAYESIVLIAVASEIDQQTI